MIKSRLLCGVGSLADTEVSKNNAASIFRLMEVFTG